MNWILTALLCIILVEAAIRLPFQTTIAGVSRSGRRALRVMQASTVSDHWKEKAMAAYARTTFLSSLGLAGLLLVLLIPAALMVGVLDRVSEGFQSFLFGWRGIGLSVVFALTYLMLRSAILHGRL